jgi:peptidase E
MKKLTPVQIETLEFCKRQIDEARNISLDISKAKKKDSAANKKILDAQNGIVYTQGGNCTIRTLKAMEERGLIEILEDNSGIGTGFGAFPTKIKILNY